MYECVPLVKKNLNYFKKLNSKRTLFNNLNEDFFEIYNKSNFAQRIFLRKTVKLLRNNFSYVGYIWADTIRKNVYNINAMNVSFISNKKVDSIPYTHLIGTIKKHCTLKYLCEDNEYNFILLESIGFQKKEGTLVLCRELWENINFDIYEDFKFELFQKGKDEQKRCEIQNKIFYDHDRIPLTLEDIYLEELQSYYFERGGVFLKKNEEYIGYGQFIIENNTPIIVNFGIIEKYRGKGYSKYLLKYLLNMIYANGFHKIIIKVRDSNYVALNLYKSIGFKIKKERFRWELEK